jgi:hypothetical protein
MREPTEDMLEAGRFWEEDCQGALAKAWCAMIDFALSEVDTN